MLGIAVAIMVRSRETRKTERIREVRIARRRMPWGYVGGLVEGLIALSGFSLRARRLDGVSSLDMAGGIEAILTLAFGRKSRIDNATEL
jgi:hypothetical protein